MTLMAKNVTFSTQRVLFKNGGSNEVQQISKSVAQISSPLTQSLYEQGGRYSSIFIRFAGLSGATAVILGI